MPDRRLTLSDIAAACGLSRATVSLVLRDGRWCAWTPAPGSRRNSRGRASNHRGAASLRRRGSNAVALVANDLGNPFFAEFVAGVDFALVGFDDLPEAAMPPPPLTTIAVAPRERGIAVARPVFARLRGDASSRPRTAIAPAELRGRASGRVASALEQIPRGAAA